MGFGQNFFSPWSARPVRARVRSCGRAPSFCSPSFYYKRYPPAWQTNRRAAGYFCMEALSVRPPARERTPLRPRADCYAQARSRLVARGRGRPIFYARGAEPTCRARARETDFLCAGRARPIFYARARETDFLCAGARGRLAAREARERAARQPSFPSRSRRSKKADTPSAISA